MASPANAPSAGAFAVRVRRLQSPTLVTGRLSSPGPDCVTICTDFGTVYAGEVLRAFVSVGATTSSPVAGVSVRLAMKAGGAEAVLDDSSVVGATMGVGQTREFVVAHRVTIIGLHHMICAIDYRTHDDKPMSVTRVFKFQTQAPFAVITKSNVAIESVQFVANPLINLPAPGQFVVDDLCREEVVLGTGHACSFSSAVRWRPDLFDDGSAAVIPLSGKFQIKWHQLASGESGCILSPPAACLAPSDLTVTVARCPSRVPMESVFDVQFRLTNASPVEKSNVQLRFNKNRLSTLRPAGCMRWRVDRLLKGQSIVIGTRFAGLAPGIQAISGLTVSDGAQEFTFDGIGHVLIDRRPPSGTAA
ncbi:unnamed protein product (mitochondrion) [Plasmodiophora brassicae]|uniref:Uncharacterized protein n=1 Tax=Plasmodiophora brassicae TaxID=37360 RepID=A0A3P3YPD7_PLABS|nr:unnamed protein product [Plasmodiophora brassicae]